MADVTVFGAGTSVETVAANVGAQAYSFGQALANAIDSAFAPNGLANSSSSGEPPVNTAEYLYVDSVSGTVDGTGYSAIVVPSSVPGASGPISIAGGGNGSQLVLAGTSGIILNAFVGNDTVAALGGSNYLYFGGVGVDSVYTATGASTIIGSTNQTTVNTGAADDVIRAMGGTTDISLGSGASTVQIEGGTVFITGSTTLDPSVSGFNLDLYASAAFTGTVLGGVGSYYIDASLGSGVFQGGWSGGNQIIGGAGASTLMGGGNNDSLYGGTGTTLIEASGGNETIGAVAGSSTDILLSSIGGADYIAIEGTDTVNLSVGSATVTVGTGSAYVVGDTLSGAYGTALEFQGGSSASTVLGGDGTYNIQAMSGGGYFVGGSAGNNIIYGDTTSGAGSVTIFGGGTGDYLAGSGGGSDSLVAATANETLASGTGDATMVGSAAGNDVFNFLQATAGSTYTVTDFNSSDFLYFSASNTIDTTSIGSGNTTLTLAEGTKIILQGYTSTFGSGHS